MHRQTERKKPRLSRPRLLEETMMPEGLTLQGRSYARAAALSSGG